MSQPEPANLKFEDTVIDFAGRRLLRDESEQPLEPKAFAVLALLAGSPGRAFTRDEILDAVWGHRHVTPGVLNRVMTLLRQALGENAHHPRLLQTVHGVGYRFDLPAPAPRSTPDAAADATPAPAFETETVPTPTRRADDTPRPPPAARARWPLLLLASIAVLVVAGWKWWPRASPTPAPVAATETATATTAVPTMDRSIAVLPLVNASNDPAQQFFSDGLSDNLIAALSRFDGLKVIGHMSSFQFRDSKDDAKAIGTKLGVAYLVGGSVQRAGGVVRINASLTRVADGSTLWAEHYDRPYQDLFALQDEIVQSVARALQAKLLPTSGAAKHGDRPPSGDIEAYNAYLQGLKHWHDEDFSKAAQYMAKAVELDPGYAMAWAHLSGSWSTTAMFRDTAAVAREHMHEARLAADKALQLAPELGPAHAAHAYLLFYEFDHHGALAECHRAVQLAPDDATVLNGCGHVLAGIGKLQEAIRLRERLLSIEPLYTVNTFKYAELLMATGRLDEAAKYLRTAQDLSQPKSSPLFQFMYVALLRGDAKAAQQVADAQQPSPWREMNLALAAQIGTDSAAADAVLAKVIQNGTWKKTSPYAVAQAYALRGDADKTVEWLERAPAGDHLFMLADPLILRFRKDPRLIAFCAKTGLPPPDTSEALGIDEIQASHDSLDSGR